VDTGIQRARHRSAAPDAGFRICLALGDVAGECDAANPGLGGVFRPTAPGHAEGDLLWDHAIWRPRRNA